MFHEADYAHSNYWLNLLILDDALAGQRDHLLNALHERGIQVRPAWQLMHRLSMFAHCPQMPLPVSESLERRIICLPSSAHLELNRD